MFAIRHGNTWVTSTRTGARMTWSSRRLARMAVKHIAKARKIPAEQMQAIEA